MKEIRLTKGLSAIVDDDDYEWLSQWKWFAWLSNKSNQTYYAVRKRRKDEVIEGNVGRRILMHRVIMKAKIGEEVDHKNHNGLDNRKSELRVCTHGQNQQNQRLRSRSLPKGVCQPRGLGLFYAQIRVNGRPYTIGKFKTSVDAARAYDRAAAHLYGDFALLNFPEERSLRLSEAFSIRPSRRGQEAMRLANTTIREVTA